MNNNVITQNVNNYSQSQFILLLLLRIAIGWHFAYEGLSKLISPSWSSAGYLMDSQGFLSGFFRSMAANEGLMNLIDLLNIWGLILVGLGLILGIFSQIAKIGGMLLLLLYYLSHPPFLGANYLIPSEGNYLIVNKNLIELLALGVLYVFPTSRITGIDRIIFGKNKK
jgi:thiosulfate dehydrogenase [quinone] large subunit